MIKWQTGRYHPVVDLPETYEVRDFTTGDYRPSEFEYDIGRYDELRPGMYSTDLFSDGRFLHMGIDIGAPVGTPCMACLLYTSPSPRDQRGSRMPSSA